MWLDLLLQESPIKHWDIVKGLEFKIHTRPWPWPRKVSTYVSTSVLNMIDLTTGPPPMATINVWKYEKLLINQSLLVLLLFWDESLGLIISISLCCWVGLTSFPGQRNNVGGEHAGGLITWQKKYQQAGEYQGENSSLVRKLELSAKLSLGHCCCQLLASKTSPLLSMAADQAWYEFFIVFPAQSRDPGFTSQQLIPVSWQFLLTGSWQGIKPENWHSAHMAKQLFQNTSLLQHKLPPSWSGILQICAVIPWAAVS